MKVRITCPVCHGRKQVWLNTEWQTNSGRYIGCGRCAGAGSLIVEAEWVEHEPKPVTQLQNP